MHNISLIITKRKNKQKTDKDIVLPPLFAFLAKISLKLCLRYIYRVPKSPKKNTPKIFLWERLGSKLHYNDAEGNSNSGFIPHLGIQSYIVISYTTISKVAQ